ncbi:TetR/AcrR family transcriptional regulator [Conexibacter sp. CPCC 206217]|uniref:TetR/AcrR family transcriptional regulator n=1 Tax=Conexibacter sp. CPCC 206217 TaxID=3064574 RepID=UPI0027286287|nr:TetR/AcrR family transcriptional regulator [Conexibacter sp. CPCC 206217]MDO8212313.1 TetR/AcrR family transcriptional regulator [Conexibacter sp. CPCC 206217]
MPEKVPNAGMPGRKRRSTAPHEQQLPSGRHGLAPRFVTANQRDRIVDALVDVVFSLGYQAASVERVSARAGVSRRTFYEQFEGREDVFLRACDEAGARLFAQVDARRASGTSASEQLHAGLEALLDGLASEPRVAHLCVVAVLSAGPQAIEHRDTQMRAFAGLLDEIAREHDGAPLPPLTAEGIVGAVYDVVYKRIAAGQASELPDLLDDLHGFCMMLFRHASDPRPE